MTVERAFGWSQQLAPHWAVSLVQVAPPVVRDERGRYWRADLAHDVRFALIPKGRPADTPIPVVVPVALIPVAGPFENMPEEPCNVDP